ncbi:hypothetical protein MalM25_36450 [Planctomycetes bacterium MalM25]|nr:hypothetical protein MalM25_36450 [Planctomycetes bacterium MalM25]
MHARAAAVLALLAATAGLASAQDEAGNTFANAEILPFGDTSVMAELLTDIYGPDLYLGVVDEFGNVFEEDDDGSPFGDGYAPALYNVPVNPGGEIAFDVTGLEDPPFSGTHFEYGQFEVFVNLYDDQFNFIDSVHFDGFIEEELVLNFFDSNPLWDGALYDIEVNNAFPNDVDFFRFSGLTPGESFTAETLEVEGGFIDTVLGWFDENGDLIASADEGGEFNYSKLSGVVPANGEVVLAVSGFGDLDIFDGSHPFMGPYELSITTGVAGPIGDYDGDLDIDADDYTAWSNAYGGTGAEQAEDGNGDGVVNAADYTIWRDALGTLSASTVPEPTSAGLAALAVFAFGTRILGREACLRVVPA